MNGFKQGLIEFEGLGGPATVLSSLKYTPKIDFDL